MPAAAVIPASVAYIKVAAVKRLVVGCQCRASVRWTLEREDKSCARLGWLSRLLECGRGSHKFPSVTSLRA